MDLASHYKAGKELTKWCRDLCALAWIPSENYEEAKNILEEELNSMKNEEEKVGCRRLYYQYFVPTFMLGKPYVRKDWIHEEQSKAIVMEKGTVILDELEGSDLLSIFVQPTSNGGAEESNKDANSKFGKHPNTRKFAKKLKEDIDSFESKLRLVKNGMINTRSNPMKKIQLQRLSMQIQNKEGSLSTRDLLTGISMTTSLGVKLKKARKE